MTLASSGAITSAQINTETGEATFDMNGTEERNLAGQLSGSYSWSDYYGQTKDGLCTEHTTNTGQTVSGTVTIALADIGAEAWNRRIMLAVHWACSTSAVVTSVSSATIGGVAATVHRSNGDGGTSATSNYGCALVSATVPTGTDATVTVTFSNTTVRNVLVTAYRITGLLSTTAFSTDQTFDEHISAPSSTSCAGVVNIYTGTEGLAFFAATGSSDGSHNAMSTTGISEQQENSLTPDGRTSSGFQMNLSTQSNRPVTTSWGASTAGRLRQVLASFELA